MRSPSLTAMTLAALGGMLLQSTGGARPLEQALLDAQWRYLRAQYRKTVLRDVAIVGIDDQAREQLGGDPEAWRERYRRLLGGLAEARAAVVGFDGGLPGGQGSELFLLDGAPAFVSAGAVSAEPVRDGADGRVRRIAVRDSRGNPTLAASLARPFGAPLRDGWIDYSRGRGFDYEPLPRVLDWVDGKRPGALERRFSGRAVLVGLISDSERRWSTPLPLAGWESDGRSAPSVMVHAQAVRTLMAGGPVTRIGSGAEMLLTVVAAYAGAALRRSWLGALLLAVLAAGAMALSTSLLHDGRWLALGAPLAAGVLSLALSAGRRRAS